MEVDIRVIDSRLSSPTANQLNSYRVSLSNGKQHFEGQLKSSSSSSFSFYGVDLDSILSIEMVEKNWFGRERMVGIAKVMLSNLPDIDHKMNWYHLVDNYDKQIGQLCIQLDTKGDDLKKYDVHNQILNRLEILSKEMKIESSAIENLKSIMGELKDSSCSMFDTMKEVHSFKQKMETITSIKKDNRKDIFDILKQFPTLVAEKKIVIRDEEEEKKIVEEMQKAEEKLRFMQKDLEMAQFQVECLKQRNTELEVEVKHKVVEIVEMKEKEKEIVVKIENFQHQIKQLEQEKVVLVDSEKKLNTKVKEIELQRAMTSALQFPTAPQIPTLGLFPSPPQNKIVKEDVFMFGASSPDTPKSAAAAPSFVFGASPDNSTAFSPSTFNPTAFSASPASPSKPFEFGASVASSTTAKVEGGSSFAFQEPAWFSSQSHMVEDKLQQLTQKLDARFHDIVTRLEGFQLPRGEDEVVVKKKRTMVEIRAEMEELQKVILDETAEPRIREAANVKIDKLFAELSNTEEYRQEIRKQKEEKLKINEPLNKEALEKYLEKIKENPQPERLKQNPALTLIGMDISVILGKHQNDFNSFLLGDLDEMELRAIRASLPQFRRDQKRQQEFVDSLDLKIEECSKNKHVQVKEKKTRPRKLSTASSTSNLNATTTGAATTTAVAGTAAATPAPAPTTNMVKKPIPRPAVSMASLAEELVAKRKK